jgi:hypothetical protein
MAKKHQHQKIVAASLGAEENQYRKAKRRIWRRRIGGNRRKSVKMKSRHRPKKESAKAAASKQYHGGMAKISASVAYESSQAAALSSA